MKNNSDYQVMIYRFHCFLPKERADQHRSGVFINRSREFHCRLLDFIWRLLGCKESMEKDKPGGNISKMKSCHCKSFSTKTSTFGFCLTSLRPWWDPPASLPGCCQWSRPDVQQSTSATGRLNFHLWAKRVDSYVLFISLHPPFQVFEILQ